MLTHRNLLHNAHLLRRALQCSEQDRLACYAGPDEPLGLVFGLILPLISGAVSLLPPDCDFQARPGRWLRLLSAGRATIAAASDDAYVRCANHANSTSLPEVNLQSLRLALHCPGAGCAGTVEGFGQTFAAHGFDAARFYPFHASPEATLIIAGGGRATSPRYASFHADDLEEGRARLVRCANGVRLASRGQPLPGQTVRIVDPGSGTACKPGEVGEIWVSSVSVAAGHWGGGGGCRRRFELYLSNGEGPFLRSGDRGFLLGGELFVLPRRGRMRPFGKSGAVRVIPSLALLR